MVGVRLYLDLSQGRRSIRKEQGTKSGEERKVGQEREREREKEGKEGENIFLGYMHVGIPLATKYLTRTFSTFSQSILGIAEDKIVSKLS